MTDDAPIYLLYLADVGRNSATFAVFTEYLRGLEGDREVRVPLLGRVDKVWEAPGFSATATGS